MSWLWDVWNKWKQILTDTSKSIESWFSSAWKDIGAWADNTIKDWSDDQNLFTKWAKYLAWWGAKAIGRWVDIAGDIAAAPGRAIRTWMEAWEQLITNPKKIIDDTVDLTQQVVKNPTDIFNIIEKETDEWSVSAWVLNAWLNLFIPQSKWANVATKIATNSADDIIKSWVKFWDSMTKTPSLFDDATKAIESIWKPADYTKPIVEQADNIKPVYNAVDWTKTQFDNITSWWAKSFWSASSSVDNFYRPTPNYVDNAISWTSKTIDNIPALETPKFNMPPMVKTADTFTQMPRSFFWKASDTYQKAAQFVDKINPISASSRALAPVKASIDEFGTKNFKPILDKVYNSWVFKATRKVTDIIDKPVTANKFTQVAWNWTWNLALWPVKTVSWAMKDIIRWDVKKWIWRVTTLTRNYIRNPFYRLGIDSQMQIAWSLTILSENWLINNIIVAGKEKEFEENNWYKTTKNMTRIII